MKVSSDLLDPNAKAATPAQSAQTLAHDLTGTLLDIAGVPVRRFTFADWTLLTQAKSEFIVAVETGSADNPMESVALFIYLMSSSLSLDQAVRLAYERPRQELLIEAVVKVGGHLAFGELKETVDEINAYLQEARSTRTKLDPNDKDSKKNASEEEQSPTG